MYAESFISTVNANTTAYAKISHFIVKDPDSKEGARDTSKAIHIRINNLSLNHNTVKMYIPEIFNNLLGANSLSNGSVEIVDPDLPEGHTDLTIPSNRFSKAMCFLNQLTYILHLTQLETFLLLIGKCQVLLNFVQIQN